MSVFGLHSALERWTRSRKQW